MRNREEHRPERLSERLRKQTEAKWREDPYLGSASDGPGVWLDEHDGDEAE